MDNREHTDKKALDAMWSRTAIEQLPTMAWWRAVWLWIKEDLFKAPIENRTEDDAIQRRIHVHEWGTACARRLRKLDRQEAQEILEVTAMLLGFEAKYRAPALREARR